MTRRRSFEDLLNEHPSIALVVVVSGALVALIAFNLSVGWSISIPSKESRWLLRHAETGDAEAQYSLGIRYRVGHEVGIDHVEATKWFLKAAEQGHAEAQVKLWMAYADGKGVAQDHAEGLKWLLKAAEQEYSGAQYELGLMYMLGVHNFEQNDVLAFMWFDLARAQGEIFFLEHELVGRMTKEQIAEAQKMAREWQAANQEK
jgi:TPR repeat protein